jgi:hypothetical protein
MRASRIFEEKARMNPIRPVAKAAIALCLVGGLAAQAQASDAVLEWTDTILGGPSVLSTKFDITSDMMHKVTLIDNGFLASFEFLSAAVTKTGGATMGSIIGPGSFSFKPPVMGSYTAIVVGTPGSFDGISLSTFGLTVSAVPEPGTYAMMLAGLGLVGWLVKRRLPGA